MAFAAVVMNAEGCSPATELFFPIIGSNRFWLCVYSFFFSEIFFLR